MTSEDRHYAGQALPGSMTRGSFLPWRVLSRAVGVDLYHGTFNVSLMQMPRLEGVPVILSEPWRLWPCRVATMSMLERGEEGVGAWILRGDTEGYPAFFVELVSEQHLRTAFKRQNWPAFAVEVTVSVDETTQKPPETELELDDGTHG